MNIQDHEENTQDREGNTQNREGNNQNHEGSIQDREAVNQREEEPERKEWRLPFLIRRSLNALLILTSCRADYRMSRDTLMKQRPVAIIGL